MRAEIWRMDVSSMEGWRVEGWRAQVWRVWRYRFCGVIKGGGMGGVTTFGGAQQRPGRWSGTHLDDPGRQVELVCRDESLLTAGANPPISIGLVLRCKDQGLRRRYDRAAR